jgi:actin-like ATPase involved in cell morphogenesis
VDICALGTHGAVIPTVVLLREDGSHVFGESADRRAVTEPSRVARQFKRRFGDSIPLLLGGTPCSPEVLTAWLITHVMSEVSSRQGGPAAALCITHPANWGPFKTDLLQHAVRLAGVTCPVTYASEPAAAAVNFGQSQRLDPGMRVAVYDLGGGTFDAAVLENTRTGFELLGHPEGIERLGGVDIDAAVFQHVADVLGDSLMDLDENEPSLVAAMSRLRQECTAAKEALSSDTDVTIPVLLPGLTTEVRLTRAELEEKLRPALYGSVEALRRALVSASVEAADLEAILLVGGSSRMPLIAQLVTAEFGRPVMVDDHPKHGVALGAAWLACAAMAEVHDELTDRGASSPFRSGALGPETAAPTGQEPTGQEPRDTQEPDRHPDATEAVEQVRRIASGSPAAPGSVTVPAQVTASTAAGQGEPGRRALRRRLAIAGAAVLATGVVGAGALFATLLRTDTAGPVTVPSRTHSATLSASAPSTSAVMAEPAPMPTGASQAASGGQARPGVVRAKASARQTSQTPPEVTGTTTSVPLKPPPISHAPPLSPPRGAP